MNEFKINQYLSVRLEEGRWGLKPHIYVDEKKFECENNTYAIIHDFENLVQTKDVRTINDVFCQLVPMFEADWEDLYQYEYDLTPQEEFWCCCSNLQVWAEHNYDCNLLYYEIAFPVLKMLKEAEDPTARKVYIQEIKKIFLAGKYFERIFLLKNGFFDEFYENEIMDLLKHVDIDLRLAMIFCCRFLFSL